MKKVVNSLASIAEIDDSLNKITGLRIRTITKKYP